MLFEHDLGVGGHVRLELLARVVDRDAHLEVGDVVLLDAHRRDLRDAAVEDLVLERLDADARRAGRAGRGRCRPRRPCRGRTPRSMSPSVITSVALAPRLRIDDTGLPISTSRVSTVPRIGARMVALARSSAARSAAALACATCARASATFAWLTAELRLRGALAVLGHVDARSAHRRAPTARSAAARRATGRARRRGARTRRPALRPRRGSSSAALRRPRARPARPAGWPRRRAAAAGS